MLAGLCDSFGIDDVRYSERFKPGIVFHFGGSTGGLVTAEYHTQKAKVYNKCAQNGYTEIMLHR
jgi:hypothetical protein